MPPPWKGLVRRKKHVQVRHQSVKPIDGNFAVRDTSLYEDTAISRVSRVLGVMLCGLKSGRARSVQSASDLTNLEKQTVDNAQIVDNIVKTLWCITN